MSWNIRGRSMELCSCEMLCPCWLGATGKPDKGWCGGALAFQIEEGSSDGVDLSGCTVALGAWWPGNFFEGHGKARVYISDKASSDQQRELEAIFTGKRGGHLHDLFGAVFDSWLPTRVTTVEAAWGEKPSLTVGDVGQATLDPLKDPTGQATKVTGAAAQAGFQFVGMDLASSIGSCWTDPDFQSWEGDSGTLHVFDWAA